MAIVSTRVESLDWLRGGLAFSIMWYHFFSWGSSVPDASSILGRLGIYGVSMFFIISGLSMAIAYASMSGMRSYAIFMVRRLFRILPLLWVVVGVQVWVISDYYYDWSIIFLNLTALFGFLSPSSYINTGAWSIGNEMVYYALTPFIIFLYNRRVLYGNLFTVFSVLIGFYFCFFVIEKSMVNGEWWKYYINPFNNLFLYCCGIAIYFNFNKVVFGRLFLLILFVFSTLVFVFYPAQGDKVNIVSGFSRVFFCVSSIGFVLFFYKYFSFYLDNFLLRGLTGLGVVSYGVYLLHPVVWDGVLKLLRVMLVSINYHYLMVFVSVVAILFSAIVYKFVELPCILLGKRITKNNSILVVRADGLLQN